MTDFFLVLIYGALIVGAVDWFTRQIVLYRRRFKGRTWDPQRPIIQRSGAQRVGLTGRMCEFCGVATFGYSDRCGKCHRLPVRLPLLPTESSTHPSLVAVEPEVAGVGAPARRSAVGKR